MSTNPARRNAIEAIASQPRLQGSFDFRNEKIDLIYGQNVFSLDKMEKRLPKDVFKSLKASIEAGIVLTGTEVKSLRFGEGSIAEMSPSNIVLVRHHMHDYME